MKPVARLIYSMFRALIRCVKFINPLRTKRRLLYLKTQSIPRSKHFSSRS